ncbi:MAG: hypothetical protein WCI18_06690, partial [Pseudomonadota bacterium]
SLLYLAFSPTEAFQFAIEDAIGPSESKRVPVLQSFEVPKGATYAVVATEEFIARIKTLLSRFPDCKPIPFERLEPTKFSGPLGLKIIQGIFRSCPDFRTALLTDESGKQATFAVFPEVTTFAYETGTYNDVLPQSRVDHEFPTQSKPRWAVLTNTAPIDKESIVLYYPGRDKAGTEIKGKQSQSISNLGILRCAFKEGSVTHGRPDSRMVKSFLEQGDKMSKTAYALGYSEEELSSAWSQYRSQPELTTFSDNFYDATYSESIFWSEARSGSHKCLSLYELAHGDSQQRSTAASYLSRIGSKQQDDGATPNCPGLAPTIALFTSEAKQLLPFSPHALPPYLEKGNLCPEKYEEFTVHLAPQIKKAFDSCRSRWNTGKSPLTALSLPGCDQNSMQQLRDFSFLSKQKLSSDFLGTSELGDNANFLLN